MSGQNAKSWKIRNENRKFVFFFKNNKISFTFSLFLTYLMLTLPICQERKGMFQNISLDKAKLKLLSSKNRFHFIV